VNPVVAKTFLGEAGSLFLNLRLVIFLDP